MTDNELRNMICLRAEQARHSADVAERKYKEAPLGGFDNNLALRRARTDYALAQLRASAWEKAVPCALAIGIARTPAEREELARMQAGNIEP